MSFYFYSANASRALLFELALAFRGLMKYPLYLRDVSNHNKKTFTWSSKQFSLFSQIILDDDSSVIWEIYEIGKPWSDEEIFAIKVARLDYEYKITNRRIRLHKH